VAATATLLALGTGVGATQAGAGPREGVADEGRLLTSSQRAALERSLRAQATTSGSPLTILLVPRLAHHDSIAALARRTFADDGLDAPGPPRVLLVVAAHERQAAIETGQGPAGIVPEVDSRRIVARLESALTHRRLAPLLDQAVTAIGDSARATAERRRPLPPEPAERAAPVAPVGVTGAAPGANGTGTGPDGSPVPPAQPGKAGGRSLTTTAGLVSAAVVIGLALRRGRRLAEERAAQPPPRPPERKGPRAAKSVGDRPMS